MPVTVTGDQPAPWGSRPGLFRKLINRFRALLAELGKFGAVGGVTFVIDLALFNLAIALGVERLTAKVISTTVAATVAFVGNRFWTWRHRERSGLAREYLLYFVFNVVGLGIGLGCLAISHYVLGSFWPKVFKSLLADNISANLVGTVLGTLFRFWSYRRFVFVGPTASEAPVAATKK